MNNRLQRARRPAKSLWQIRNRNFVKSTYAIRKIGHEEIRLSYCDLVLLHLDFRVAQDPYWNRAAQNQFLDGLAREFMYRQFTGYSLGDEEARRRAAQYSEQQFIQKANAFTRVWSAFIVEYNQKKAFNVRIGKEATKAFHDLERSEGWRRTP